MKMAGKQNINIQLLRAIAALSVVLYHTSVHYFIVGGTHEGNLFSFMSQIGYAGVDIFFVISGYIMWISTKRLSGWSGVKQFVFSRVMRIYPVYWIFLAFMIWFYHKSLYNFDLWGSVFLTFSSSSKLLLQVAWTLQYELYFYALFALLILLPRRFLLPLFIAIFFLIIGIQLYGGVILNMYDKHRFNGMGTLWTFWTSPFILEFILGVFTGYYFEHFRIKYILPVMSIIIGLLYIALYYQTHTIHALLAEGYYLPERIIFLGVTAMLLVGVAVELHRRKVSLLPWFSSNVGDASYSLYLSHSIVLLFIYSIGLRDYIAQEGHYPFLWMIAIVCILVWVSVIHYRWVEKPLLSYTKKLRRYL